MSKLVYEKQIKANMRPAADVIKSLQEGVKQAAVEGCKDVVIDLYYFSHADPYAQPDHFIQVLGYKGKK